VITPHDVITEARALKGTPYRHQGRSSFGIDCVGLVLVVMERLGTINDDLRHANYGRLPREELIRKTATHCTRLDAVEPGALILIRWPGESNPGHSAICTGTGMIHAFATLEKVVEHGYRGAWVKQTHSFWRLPGVISG
jgi:cell wall-associated NlpC family hydrolase